MPKGIRGVSRKMLSGKGKGLGLLLATVALDHAKTLASDPERLSKVMETVNPQERLSTMQKAIQERKERHRESVLANVEEVLRQIDITIDEQHVGVTDEHEVGRWREEIASLRSAIPLVRVSQGKAWKIKEKKLLQRANDLLDSVFEVTTGL
ncbi:hypothetical protein [Actinomyces vulturis]|uniref:hypothetical protein n=1 Tax=Actinomyces vulturis TaxID=1857645 RepID=UPI000833CA04|nr:hypothetical protein [Actinomyces vulturis]